MTLSRTSPPGERIEEPLPSAGAPKGNFNALKHARRSAQFAELGALIAANPTTRAAILNFAHRLGVKEQSAIKGAVELHVTANIRRLCGPDGYRVTANG